MLGGDGRSVAGSTGCRAAGVTDIALSVQPEVHWHGSPGFAAWVQNIIGNLESARIGMLGAGLISEAAFVGAVGELEQLKADSGGSAVFVWNRAVGVR
jgi:hypothetical protein